MLNILLFNGTNQKYNVGMWMPGILFEGVEFQDFKDALTKRLNDLNIPNTITLDSKIDEKTDLDQFDIILCNRNTKRYLDLNKIKKAKIIVAKYKDYGQADFDTVINDILSA